MVDPGTETPPLPPRRVILLGASNLVLGLSTVLSAAQAAWGHPLDILAALGHGRGYGLESRVLGRVLPPILDCGLWSDLNRRPPAPTASLVTDIGNDLVFGARPEQLREWIETVLARLSDHSAKITVSQLPLASLQKLGEWRYRVARSVLFPRSQLAFADAVRRAAQVNQDVIDLADQFGATIVEPLADWYGYDPIHIRRSARAGAWQAMLATWCDGGGSVPDIADSQWYLRRLRPLHRVWFGIEQSHPQPAGKLVDGSLLSLY